MFIPTNPFARLCCTGCHSHAPPSIPISDKTEISNGPLESDHCDQEVISCLLKGRGPDSTGGNGGAIGGRSQCGEGFLGGHAMVVASGVSGINIFPRCNAKHLAMIT